MSATRRRLLTAPRFPTSPIAIQVIRVSLTVLIVALAILAGWRLWTHYEDDPWTRDGRVHADGAELAPDVPGLVTAVHVGNDAVVHRGEVLFDIDRPRYAIALAQARAGLSLAIAAQVRTGSGIARARAELAEAEREAQRNRALGDLVAIEVTQQSETKVAAATAALADAQSGRELAENGVASARIGVDLAQLNLDRTRVIAPFDGRLSDVTLRVGDYVTPGKPVMALIDTASLRIEGYFEETKLAQVHVGQAAIIHLMGERRELRGHVQSIATAIADHDRTASPSMLPAINPNFSWVRLAQRVPVRIAIDSVPTGVALIPGRTATITLARDPHDRNQPDYGPSR